MDVDVTTDAAWTVDEASRFLGIKPKTLYRKAAEGTVPSFKVGGALRFSPARLAEWREAQARGGRG
ncbi:helix-turn-helix domain-containing protein [Archangium primigenium]|nr:helix-turn-helix domain-containing protein [Archangium primigenium]